MERQLILEPAAITNRDIAASPLLIASSAKTNRIELAPFNLPSEPIGSLRTGYQLIMCARATTAPSCSGFTIDQIGAIMRHVRPDPPDEDNLCRNAHRWRARGPDLLLGL